MLRWCSLHVLNLGIDLWAGASCMELLLEQDSDLSNKFNFYEYHRPVFLFALTCGKIPGWYMDSWFLWWSTKCCLCWVPELVPRPKDSVPYLTLVALVYLSKSQSSLALLATVKLRHSQPPFTHGQFLRGGDVNAKQMAAKGYNVSWLAHVPLKVLTYIYSHAQNYMVIYATLHDTFAGSSDYRLACRHLCGLLPPASRQVGIPASCPDGVSLTHLRSKYARFCALF